MKQLLAPSLMRSMHGSHQKLWSLHLSFGYSRKCILSNMKQSSFFFCKIFISLDLYLCSTSALPLVYLWSTSNSASCYLCLYYTFFCTCHSTSTLYLPHAPLCFYLNLYVSTSTPPVYQSTNTPHWSISASTLPLPVIYIQGGTTCGAIEESSRSLKSIDKRVFINFCNKYAVFTNFCDKNYVFEQNDKNCSG